MGGWRWRGRARRAAVALAALVVAGSALPAARAATRTTTGSSSCQWPMYGQNPSRTMTSSCAAAPTTATASLLLPRWSVHATDVVTASPSIVDGVVYVGDWNGTFYALDLANGATRWSTVIGLHRTDGNTDRHTGAYGVITSSAAIATVGGRKVVFVGAGDSLYALDASRDEMPDAGRVLWRRDLDPAHPTSHGEIESSPVVWAGAPGGPVVFVGSDANQDSGYPGEGIWAIRAATGAVVWHFSPELATKHALYGCGNVWSSPALGLDPTNRDPARRAVLYFGTADCPDNGTTACPSDRSDPYCPPGRQYVYADRWERFSESIDAISAVDGSPLWSYQGHPPLNSDDDDYGASAQLFALPGGRSVVGEGGKDGLYYVLDRATGSLIWKRSEVGDGNLERSFALGGFIGDTAVMSVSGTPRVFGGSAIDTPITYDPATGKSTLQPVSTLEANMRPFTAFSGATGLTAWTGAQLYTYGATTAANGVVYSGSLDGILHAYDATTGRLLWAFPVGAPISSGAAITAGTVVVGAGTSESDLEFKACDRVPSTLSAQCKATPLSTTLNPLSDVNGIWAFSVPGTA